MFQFTEVTTPSSVDEHGTYVALSQECTLGPESAWKKSLYSEVALLETSDFLKSTMNQVEIKMAE